MAPNFHIRSRYPISLRWVLGAMAPWTAAVMVVLFLVMLIEQEIFTVMQFSLFDLLALLSFQLLSLRLLYLLLYRYRYDYEFVGDELIIRRGVFFPTPVGMPLNKIMAIHVTRSPLQILLGLATVVFIIPGELPRKLVSISGLTVNDAAGLKALIFQRN